MSTTPTLSIPRIGQPWPGQGGIYAGILRGADGQPDRHVIVAATDAVADELAWGGYGEDVSDAKDMLDGAANTKALLAHGAHRAAQACAEYEAEGHADYHLPSPRELALAQANVPELFGDQWYWSSAQHSRRYAFCQYFQYGTSSWGGKDYELRVRPFRGFILESLDHLTPSTAEGGPAAIFSDEQQPHAKASTEGSAA